MAFPEIPEEINPFIDARTMQEESPDNVCVLTTIAFTHGLNIARFAQQHITALTLPMVAKGIVKTTHQEAARSIVNWNPSPIELRQILNGAVAAWIYNLQENEQEAKHIIGIIPYKKDQFLVWDTDLAQEYNSLLSREEPQKINLDNPSESTLDLNALHAKLLNYQSSSKANFDIITFR